MNAFVYILRCRDDRFYVGTTRGSLEHRVAEHNAGVYDGFTKSRRPVDLVFHQDFDRITDAIAAEQQLKGWSRAKKEALIRGDIDALKLLSRNRSARTHPSSCSGWGQNLRLEKHLMLSLSKHELPHPKLVE